MELPDFSSITILVAGDLMLDRYWSGQTGRISPEAPVPIVRIDEVEDRPGGAGNVALNLAALGCRVILLGCRGGDEAGQRLEQLLQRAGVDCRLLISSEPTVVKLRILSQHQQLIRLDFEQPLDGSLQAQFLRIFEDALAEANGVALSDYAKGTLANCPLLLEAARKKNLPAIVDPKGTDFGRYRGATALTPNLKEFSQFAGPWASEAEMRDKAESWCRQLDLQALLVTRGQEGMSLFESGQDPVNLSADSKEVFDVTGAGDTVIAWFTACIAAGASMQEAATLANRAAGLAVGKLGAEVVKPGELGSFSNTRGVLEIEALRQTVQAAKARGEKIVLTNGCFDILHAGHVHYLQAARVLGDRLVVLVNDDDSVRRLKGPDRPVNPLAYRASVLAALECVDWVASFSQDTPRELICQLLPDILVKGADYSSVDGIAGADCVKSAGGNVKLLPLLEGCSTSKIIDKMAGL